VKSNVKPTFGQVFAFSLVGLIAILALLFELVSSGSRETVRESSKEIRDQASSAISERITGFLGVAPDVVAQFQREVTHGILNASDPHSVEPGLFALLLANDDLGEITFTYGAETGFNDDGEVTLAPDARGQWSLIRDRGKDGEPRLWSRHVYQEGVGFVAERRDLSGKTALASSAWVRESGGNFADPTAHPTFITPARKDFRGRAVWSDLHWSQLDADLPKERRRVEVSVQQSVTDAAGKFLGVLRVGLLTERLDEKVGEVLGHTVENDPHRAFLCDSQGRLITRITPTDRLEEMDDDLRISSGALPPEIKAALASPILRAAVDNVDSEKSVSGEFTANGQVYFATFRALRSLRTQDWIIGILVPRAYYFDQLNVMRQRLLAVLLAVMVLLVAAGAFILWGVRRGQAQITRESLKMNAFDFSPTRPDSLFRDVADVLESQEKAKSAMRAMSKYVPVDLVRRLYRDKREPVLGGELMQVTLMFTDIKDFTAVSERLAPNDLADALGRYLAVMAQIIQQETRGTIDKFIGDAIMTFWNAPEPVPEHAHMACQAALRCRAAARAQAQSSDWGALPAFETRFGLHSAPALIGHFGAPDRMNYTAMGDAVNLASRLEGLNKQYGTSIIASETIVRATGATFVFRLLDRVAVKGKTEAIRIYELLGQKGEAGEIRDVIASYEKAFAAYSARDFDGAIAILEKQPTDGPSVRLLARCRMYLSEAPPVDWDGIYVSRVK
jgi:adenylate cyclase